VPPEAIREQFRIQKATMPLVAIVLDGIAAPDARSYSRLVADFLRQRSDELSFVATATNARKMSSLAEQDLSEANINIRSEYSSPRVLTWEFIDGRPVASLIGAARDADATVAALPEHDLKFIARRIYRNALNQIFRDGIFHADVSAAGLLVLPTNTMAYVDFAVVGQLDNERLRLLQAEHECLLKGHVDDAADKLLNAAAAPIENSSLRRSLVAILEDRLDGFESPVNALPRKVSQITYQRLMSAFHDHGVLIPRDLSTYFGAMLTIEALIFEIYPRFDAVAEQSRFFSMAAKQDYRQSLELPYVIENVGRLYRDATDLMSDLRKLHNSARTIDVSLRTLRIRLLQYGFWASLAAACAYFGLREEILLGEVKLKALIVPVAVVAAAFLVSRVLRQSRQLSYLDRAAISTGEVSSRSRGRVR